MANRWVIRPVVDSVSRLRKDSQILASIATAKKNSGSIRENFRHMSGSELHKVKDAYLDTLYTMRYGMKKPEYEGKRKRLNHEI